MEELREFNSRMFFIPLVLALWNPSLEEANYSLRYIQCTEYFTTYYLVVNSQDGMEKTKQQKNLNYYG